MITQPAEKILPLKKGEEVAKRSTSVVAILCVFKAVIGVFSGSIALIADAINSFTDIFGNMAVYAGLKLSQKAPTERFPYGYYKAETFATFAVSIIIFVAGVEIIREAVIKLISPQGVSYSTIVLLTASVSTIISYILANYKEKTGRRVNSQALIAEGKESRVDVYASIIVIVGVLFSHFGLLWVEPVAGLAIAILILRVGIIYAKDSALVLMDASLDPESIVKMKNIAMNTLGVRGVHSVRLRKSGPYFFGEMHVGVQEDVNIEKAHLISEKIEQEVKEKLKQIDSLIIHMEPIELAQFKVAIPVDENRELESKLSLHLGKAPFFLLVDIDRGNVVGWTVHENPSISLEKKKGITAAELLVKQRVNFLLAVEVGVGPFHILRDKFIKIYKLPDSLKTEEALDAFLKGKLKEMRTASESREGV